MRRALGIEMHGTPVLEHNLDFFFRAPDLWNYHDKGKAALYFFIDRTGLWRTVVQIDGQELWRLNLRGKELYDNPGQVDPHSILSDLLEVPVPYRVISSATWTARDLVADRYRHERVFLAGDAAHQNTPSGGFGLNTGLGDAVDLGWKLAASIQGWGGTGLLDSYEAERRPIAVRNVRQATDNHRADQRLPVFDAIDEFSAAGALARLATRDAILREKRRMLITDGTALGYTYSGSPIICEDGSPEQPDEISEYIPTSRSGARAPHAWLTSSQSVIDLFGRGFSLLRMGDDAPDTAPFEQAFSRRGAPLSVFSIRHPDVCELYACKAVLVRPDGHVAWRSDLIPEDVDGVVDRVCGRGGA